MWNLGINNGNIQEQRNRYGTPETEFIPAQKFPSVDGPQWFSGQPSLYGQANHLAGEKFLPDVPTVRNTHLSSDLRNGTHQMFSATNSHGDNQRMFTMHNQPEQMNNGWGQADPNYYAAGLQMKNVEFQGSSFDSVAYLSRVAGPSLVNAPSVDDPSQMPISQNFVPSLPNFSLGRDFVSPNPLSGGQTDVSAEIKAPQFPQLMSYQTGPPVHDSNLDVNNTTGSVFYAGAATGMSPHGYAMNQVRQLNTSGSSGQIPAPSEFSQGYPPYYPKTDAHDSIKSDPAVSEISSETYKKACDALLAYAQKKRNATGLDAGNVSVKADVSPSETGVVTDSPAGLSEEEPSIDLRNPSFTGNIGGAKVLWDGILQLNASTEVPVIAVFKSGEKVLDPNWEKIVDVKGKVRLEAFEKFVQELPRSRNRALMVISIHWKVGTPQSGLKGMKEVAKSYKDQHKVGYAQFSPGVDLYVCPRSDSVITILAKHGFFKGMEAVEEDQNSLIGCVVWRRSKPTSDPPKDRNEQVPADSIDPVEQGSSSSSAANPSDATALVPPVQPLTSQMDLHNILSNAVSLLIKDASEITKPPPQPSIDFQPTGQRPPADAANDEDLPEFDFSSAIGVETEKKPAAVKDGPAPLASLGMPGRTSPFTEFDFSSAVGVEPEKKHAAAKDGPAPLGSLGMPGQTSRFTEFDFNKSIGVETEKKPAAVKDGPAPLGNLGMPGRTSRFNDDDDDMPEWQPPTTARQVTPPPPPPPPLPPLPPPPSLLASQAHHGLPKQDQRGILGQRPMEMYPKVSSMEAGAGDRRPSMSGRRLSPEDSTSQSRAAKQRRTSGWDIETMEEKSDRWSHHRSRE